ncbi:MAG: catechol 2,3-dioxygenase-like lactoylglutathione lyase family enzyme [Pseudohongiellaceae bacterium]|jgi:catechol 2,3-dioxygenase-like lactoylglutathione lyase family enzyme
MLSYVSVGTNNFDAALKFYDSLFAELDGKRSFNAPNEQFYSFGKGSFFGVLAPFNDQPATVGNGTMFAFNVDSPQRVAEVFNRALEFGAADEGKPGPRGDQGFYAAYLRDLDGNKLCIYHK